VGGGLSSSRQQAASLGAAGLRHGFLVISEFATSSTSNRILDWEMIAASSGTIRTFGYQLARFLTTPIVPRKTQRLRA